MNTAQTKIDNVHTIKAVDFIQDITLGGDLLKFIDYTLEKGHCDSCKQNMWRFYNMVEKPQYYVDFFNKYLESEKISLRVKKY